MTTHRLLSSDEVLHSPFNLNVHKEYFTNYLEVVVRCNGTVEYAVPSHNTKLFMIWYEKKYGKKLSYGPELFEVKREKEITEVPRDWWLDMIQFYVNETSCVCMWDKYCISPKQGITKSQFDMMHLLKQNKLYLGEIPEDLRID